MKHFTDVGSLFEYLKHKEGYENPFEYLSLCTIFLIDAMMEHFTEENYFHRTEYLQLVGDSRLKENVPVGSARYSTALFEAFNATVFPFQDGGEAEEVRLSTFLEMIFFPDACAGDIYYEYVGLDAYFVTKPEFADFHGFSIRIKVVSPYHSA